MLAQDGTLNERQQGPAIEWRELEVRGKVVAEGIGGGEKILKVALIVAQVIGAIVGAALLYAIASGSPDFNLAGGFATAEFQWRPFHRTGTDIGRHSSGEKGHLSPDVVKHQDVGTAQLAEAVEIGNARPVGVYVLVSSHP